MSHQFKNEALNKHRELANAVKEHLQVEGSVISEKEEHSAYNATLPEGLTPELVDKLSKHTGKFITAAHVAINELATDIFTGDKSINTVTAQVGVFAKGDKIKSVIEREKSFTVHLDKTKEPTVTTKNLVSTRSVELDFQSAPGLKAAIGHMQQEYRDTFAG